MPMIDSGNSVSTRLNSALPGWYVESDGDSAAYAYNLDPRTSPNREEVESITVRDDYGPPWSVSYSAYNPQRGMGDLVEHREAGTLHKAVSEARSLEKKYRGEFERGRRTGGPSFPDGSPSADRDFDFTGGGRR